MFNLQQLLNGGCGFDKCMYVLLYHVIHCRVVRNVNLASNDYKVLSATQVMGEDEVSPNYANKVIANPLQNLNPLTSKPKVPPKKTRKVDKNIKWQKKIVYSNNLA